MRSFHAHPHSLPARVHARARTCGANPFTCMSVAAGMCARVLVSACLLEPTLVSKIASLCTCAWQDGERLPVSRPVSWIEVNKGFEYIPARSHAIRPFPPPQGPLVPPALQSARASARFPCPKALSQLLRLMRQPPLLLSHPPLLTPCGLVTFARLASPVLPRPSAPEGTFAGGFMVGQGEERPGPRMAGVEIVVWVGRVS